MLKRFFHKRVILGFFLGIATHSSNVSIPPNPCVRDYYCSNVKFHVSTLGPQALTLFWKVVEPLELEAWIELFHLGQAFEGDSRGLSFLT